VLLLAHTLRNLFFAFHSTHKITAAAAAAYCERVNGLSGSRLMMVALSLTPAPHLLIKVFLMFGAQTSPWRYALLSGAFIANRNVVQLIGIACKQQQQQHDN